MVLDPGTLLEGRYCVGAVAGSGGMADVYRAFDERLQRPVAVKVLRGVEPDDARRFEAEARALARLAHPAIVGIYDVGEHDGTPFLVVDLVEGGSLADEIARGPAALPRVVAVGQALAEALDHAHELGVVHRDVKPSNILLDAHGHARLADFGIARMAGAPTLTATGTVMGTASYLAPEQLSGDPVGPAADVYALGLVLLECLSGERAYTGTATEAAMARLHRPPEVPTGIDLWLAELLVAMTEIDPARRPSAHAVAATLARRPPAAAVATTAAVALAPTGLGGDTERFLVGAEPGSPGAAGSPGAPVTPRRRAPWLGPVLAGAAALALVVAAVVAARGDGAGPGVSPQDQPVTSTTAPPETTPSATSPPETTSPRSEAPGSAPDPGSGDEPGRDAPDRGRRDKEPKDDD